MAVVAEWMFGYGASAFWGFEAGQCGNWNLFWLLQVILLALIPIPMVIAGVETRGRKLDSRKTSHCWVRPPFQSVPRRGAPGGERPGRGDMPEGEHSAHA